ncbi:hypothetical protein Pmani_030019 [Petrolisthes manimaculis]|uniref:Transmembrane protein 223 n=1 Tax=Petrolisthes manimaculis TaxID=1843537 RepID=A0AAE1NY79_9EUCA|nr:hypothetical protein Pmani_030019 [Petrolisthes manimaculis]
MYRLLCVSIPPRPHHKSLSKSFNNSSSKSFNNSSSKSFNNSLSKSFNNSSSKSFNNSSSKSFNNSSKSFNNSLSKSFNKSSKFSGVLGSLRLMVGQSSNSVRSYSSNSGRLRLMVGQSSNKSFSKSSSKSFSKSSKFSGILGSLRLMVGQSSSKFSGVLGRLRLMVGQSSNRSFSSNSGRLRLMVGQSSSKFSGVLGSLRLMVGQSSSRSYSSNSGRLRLMVGQSSSKFSGVLGRLRLMVGQSSSRSFSNNKSQRLMILEHEHAVSKDTVLFTYDNGKFFKLLNLFAISQFCFWSYLSNFAFVTMRNVQIPEEVQADAKLPWWKKTNFGQFRYGITISSFLIGWGTLGMSWMYTIRCVRYLVLLRGGRQLAFITFTPFGRTRQITVPLEKVSAVQSRMSVKTHLPLKVQGKSLHYLLDMRGKFTNTKLFDYSAGLKRSWAK